MSKSPEIKIIKKVQHIYIDTDIDTVFVVIFTTFYILRNIYINIDGALLFTLAEHSSSLHLSPAP